MRSRALLSHPSRPGATSAARTRGARAARIALTTAGVVGSLLLVDVGAAHAATSDDFAQLRQCESGGNYGINTGNGFYGAYQFTLGTWRDVGGTGYPHQASPATQDALAAKLQSQRGWQPWPACSIKLGLRGGSQPSVTVRQADQQRATRASGRSAAYSGHLMTTSSVGTYRADVQALQARLAEHGYQLSVDGYYGSQTRGVVADFQRDAGIAVDGVVGPQTWAAAF